MQIHLTARLSPGSRLLRGLAAGALWSSLRRSYPDALAAVLMPDHLHLIAPTADPAAERSRLGRVLQRHTRTWRLGRWRVAEPRDPIPDRLHLGRQVRYVALNPCRSRYTDDPLRWMWTTHRDVVGATAEPWVTPGRLAAALGRPGPGFARDHHNYVAGDPTVASSAMPAELHVAEASLDALARAAAAAVRHVGRRRSRREGAALFLALARETRYTIEMARGVVHLPSTTARRWSRRPTPRALTAARRCLADPRLTSPRDEPGFSLDLRVRRGRRTGSSPSRGAAT